MATMGESGPMSCKDHTLLDHKVYRQILHEKLEPTHLLTHLGLSISNECRKRVIRANKQSPAEAVDVLIDGLRQRDMAGWFVTFKDALREADFEYLYKLLDGASSVPPISEQFFLELIALFYSQLCDIDVHAVCPHLEANHCISKVQREEVYACLKAKGNHDAMMLLLTNIANFHPDWFPRFIHALNESSYRHFSAELNEYFPDASSLESIQVKAEYMAALNTGERTEDSILIEKRRAQNDANASTKKRMAHTDIVARDVTETRRDQVHGARRDQVHGTRRDQVQGTRRDQVKRADVRGTESKEEEAMLRVLCRPEDATRTSARLSPCLSSPFMQAIFLYLSTELPPFKPELISENVLQKLLKQNVIEQINVKDPNADECVIYKRGQTGDYFVLLLQGKAKVVRGDGATTIAGPFEYFGAQPLINLSKHHSLSSISSASDSMYGSKQPTYVPDFTLRALENTQYLKLARSHYVAARRATLMERQPRT